MQHITHMLVAPAGRAYGIVVQSRQIPLTGESPQSCDHVLLLYQVALGRHSRLLLCCFDLLTILRTCTRS